LALLLSTGAAALQPAPAHATQVNHTLTVNNTTTGKSPRFMGENVDVDNTYTDSEKEWTKNSGINSARLWMNDYDFEPSNDNGPYGNGVTSLSSFNTAKNAVINNPASNSYINWTAFHNNFSSMDLDDNLAFFQGNGITPIAVLRTDVTSHDPDGTWLPAHLTGWADYWEWWEYCFAIAYHLYNDYGFLEFEIGNEVNLDSRYTPQEYAVLLQYANDAIQSAVHAVNSSSTPNVSLGAFGANVTLSPSVADYLGDVLTANGTGIGTQKADNFANLVSYHNYQDPEKSNNSGPDPDPKYTINSIQGSISTNNPDASYEDLMITEGNLKVGDVDPDDYTNNAKLAELLIQLINQGKDQSGGHSYLRGFVKFRFTSATVNSPFPDNGSTVRTAASAPEIDHAHQYYFTYYLLAQALKGRKDVMSITTTINGDQVIVTRDADYYYVLNTNLSSTDTEKITLDTTALGITSSPVYVSASSSSNQAHRWEKQITNGTLTYFVGSQAVNLLRIPRNYTAKTISSISISPSSTVTVDPYGAKHFTATATYSDSTTADISDKVSWNSSNSANVNILDTGLAYGVTASSQANITCSYQGVTSGSVTFIVN
jgi:hypothetical protein